MTTDAKDTEVPSTPAPLPEAAAPETKVEAAPIVDKGGDTPAAPPAASAKAETPATPTKVVDEAGDELTPEEQETMARLTGQDTKKKDEAPAAPAAAEAPKTPETPAAPAPVETAEEVGGIKLPTSHELAGYKPETRKRIEQFTSKIKETAPLAQTFTDLVDGFRAVGVTPEQFHAWQDLGIELRSKDPGVRKAALDTLHDLAVKTGLKVEAPEPDNTAVLAKIQELEKSLDIEPSHAEALRAALAAKPAKQPAPAATPAPVNQPDPRQMVEQAVFNERVNLGRYTAQEALNEVTAKLPVADHQSFQEEVMAELVKIETGLQNNPAELNNTLKWGARMRTAANIVLSRRATAKPPSQTVLPTQSLRPTTPNVGQSDEPQPGTEEYELAVLMGKITPKR